MIQQWQQMTSQQKAMAIGLLAVIVVALLFIIWYLVGSQQAPPAPPPNAPSVSGTPTSPTPAGSPPTAPMPSAPMGSHSPMPAPAAPLGTPPELAGTPAAPQGAIPPTPTPGGVGAPTGVAAPAPEKATKPPQPGRPDPFAALPSKPVGDFPPFIPPFVPSPQTQEPVVEPVKAREQPTERLPQLPMSSVPPRDLASYLASSPPPQTVTASGWRMAGLLMSEQKVSALLQFPDGRTRSVQPGSTVEYAGTTYTVTLIEPERLILRSDKGEELIVPRRPAPAPPTAGGSPFGAGAPSSGGGFSY
jgi:hypothetical protein